MTLRDLVPRRFVRTEGLLVVSRKLPDTVIGLDDEGDPIVEPGAEVNDWSIPGRGIRWLGRVWRFRPDLDWRPPR